MILTAASCPKTEQQSIVALFGAGLVGGAVLRALHKRKADLHLDLALSWRDAQERKVDLGRITQVILAATDRFRRIDVVWAAGRAGFGAGREELVLEVE